MDSMQEGMSRRAREAAIRYARVPAVYIIVRHERCKGCGVCVRGSFCRFGAISVVERKAQIDERRCRGCGRCTHLCPKEALAIELRPPSVVRGVLEDIDKKVTKLTR